jgi:hypothetical protein
VPLCPPFFLETTPKDDGPKRIGPRGRKEARRSSVIAAQLGLDPEEMVTCGMLLGYADAQAPVNRLNMPREPLEAFTQNLPACARLRSPRRLARDDNPLVLRTQGVAQGVAN